MQLLEHVHVNVNSIAATCAFLQRALPQMKIRGSGEVAEYGSWLHIGDAHSYIALTEVCGAKPAAELRHIGLVVDDIEALIERLQSAGITASDQSELDSHPHRRRVYYVDDNGLDWEFVQYLSEDFSERNDYSL